MRSSPTQALLALALLVAALTGCARADERERMVLVTTTSVEASGLLDVLSEAYHAAQDRYRLAPAAVGSGAALEMGRRGDADLLLTHEPGGERAFAADGLAAEQGPVMMNHFILAGPASDPAGVAGATSAPAALSAIAAASARFVSRGDDSGTHVKERALWRDAGMTPWEERPDWYVEAGTGMGETLQMASQLGAYTLTDRGTFLHLGHVLQLEALLQNGRSLENRYTFTLPTNSGNVDGARDFIAWLRGPGQELIAEYGVLRFGEPLFVPAALPDSAG